MNRRGFLASVSGALGAAVAGCVSDADGADGPKTGETPSRTTGGSPTPTPPDDGVAVADVTVRKAVRYESTMGSGGVLAAEGRQYVVASVRSERDLSGATFTFEADGESWAPGLSDTAGAINNSVAGRGGGPVGRPIGGGRAFLAFEVPSPLSAADPRIRLAGSDASPWSLPAEARERLAAPAARFELAQLDAPDRVAHGDPLDVSLTVRNVSDVDGRFLAAIYWPTRLIADDDESHVVEREVPAGATATASRSLDTEYATGDADTLSLRVRGHVSAERGVDVHDVSSPY